MAVQKAPAAGTKHLESPQQHRDSSTAVLRAVELQGFTAGTYRLWVRACLWLSIPSIHLVCNSDPKIHCSFPKYKVARPNSTFQRQGGFVVSLEQQCREPRFISDENSSCEEEIAAEHEEICRAHHSSAGFSPWVPCVNGCSPEHTDIQASS